MKEDIINIIKKDVNKISRIENKNYLVKMIKEDREGPKVSERIGCMLLYNQVIEELLKAIIKTNHAYIKVKLYPAYVDLYVDEDKLTFGSLIDYFQKNVIKFKGRRELIDKLLNLKKYRNEIIHQLFLIDDLKELTINLYEYQTLADEIYSSLIEYYDKLARKLYDLCDSIDKGILDELLY